MKNKIEDYKGSVWAHPFYNNVEYEMSREFAREILKTRKGNELNIPPQKFLCDYVNRTFGVKGNVVHVITI